MGVGARHENGHMDTRTVNGTTLTVIGHGETPLIPDTGLTVVAVGIGVPLNDGQQNRLAGLVGYVWRAHLNVHHRLIYDTDPDHPDLIIFNDAEAPGRSDPTYAWTKVTDTLSEYVQHGTPVRKTDRAGAGTKGTRLVDGFGEDASHNLRIYADRVVDVSSAAFLQAMSGVPTRA